MVFRNEKYPLNSVENLETAYDVLEQHKKAYTNEFFIEISKYGSVYFCGGVKPFKCDEKDINTLLFILRKMVDLGVKFKQISIFCNNGELRFDDTIISEETWNSPNFWSTVAFFWNFFFENNEKFKVKEDGNSVKIKELGTIKDSKWNEFIKSFNMPNSILKSIFELEE